MKVETAQTFQPSIATIVIKTKCQVKTLKIVVNVPFELCTVYCCCIQAYDAVKNIFYLFLNYFITLHSWMYLATKPFVLTLYVSKFK